MLVAERAALEIHEYSPRLVKQTVVGHGNAEKFQVQQMVKTLLSLEPFPNRMTQPMRWLWPFAIFIMRPLRIASSLRRPASSCQFQI